MLFYIDYLDHITSGLRTFEKLRLRLRYDLLIFGQDTLCMSVPACVKLEDTTNLLLELDEFWKNGRIRLQLDQKHKGNPANYFRNRKNVLTKSMSEEKLINHFEFVAYESDRTTRFFDTYLPERLSLPSSSIYIGKDNDTDMLFRQSSIDLFQSHYDYICEGLDVNRSIVFTGITNKIHGFALDKSSLYQRALIEDAIIEEFKPLSSERTIVASLLDRAFARANAKTSNAIPLSLIRNQLTGRWLYRLLYRSYRNLYSLINSLTWPEVYALSQDKDWIDFIGCINALVMLMQDSKIKKYHVNIDDHSKAITKSLALLNLLKYIKEEAIDAMKDKMFEFGLFSEAQKLEESVGLIASCYVGRFKPLIDTLSAVDFHAKRVAENLTTKKDYEHIIKLGQSEKYYDLMP